MTRRVMDMGASEQLGIFLDRHFYKWLISKHNVKNIKRINSKASQLKGIDVAIETINNRTFYIDEKAQIYYLNKFLPTFAFEVESINKIKEISVGWLVNEGLLTDYFLLIWPFAKHDNLEVIKAEDFLKLHCLLIKKKSILEYLSSKGWDIQKLSLEAKKIRKSKPRKHIKIEGEDDFYFYFSEYDKYTEQPINIVIKRDVLRTIADHEYIVKPDEVKQLT